jgi:regulator of protease activity HflC (stomatin/prohibitin superfamily)
MGNCCQCVSSGNVGVVEKLGKFQYLAHPGIHCLLPPICDVVGQVSLRVQQLSVRTETKTKDNVTIQVQVAVQFKAMESKVQEAYYRLTDPGQQIRAYVDDVIRSTLPKLELDEAFQSKDTVALSVKESLDKVMHDYGYEIKQALVTDLSPDVKVKSAMNEINAQKRLRESATHKADANKIIQVKAAEAEAEAKYLAGVGVARQRQAIVQGFRDSVNEFSGNVDGINPKDVMNLMMITQYLDMLKDVGCTSSRDTIFVPHTPNALTDIQMQIKTGLQASVA